MRVGKDRFLPGEHFLRKAVHCPIGGAPARVAGTGLFRHAAGKEHAHGNRKEHAENERDGDRAHHDEAACDRDETCQDLDHVGGEAERDHVDVVAHAADDVAGLVAVKVPLGQAHQLVKHRLAHPFGYPFGHVHHDKMNGNGTYYYSAKAKGYKLEGSFKNNQPDGKCTYYLSESKSYTTHWSKGKCTKLEE